MKKILENKKGTLIVEILVVIAIIIIGLVSLLSLMTYSLKISSLARETSQANLIAQETIEAVRNFRDGTVWNTDGLGTPVAGSNYYPRQYDSPLKWQLIQGVEIIGIFTRKVVIEKVSRDSTSYNIETTYNPSNDDSNTRKVTATVSWKDKEVKIITYFTNWK